MRLVELAMKKGADAFVRDRRGKRVLEGDKGADERIKVFLKQCKFVHRRTKTNARSSLGTSRGVVWNARDECRIPIDALGDMSGDVVDDQGVANVFVLYADNSPKPGKHGSSKE